MDYVPGGEMYAHIRKNGGLPEKVAQFYAAEVTSVLEYLHSLDLAHRDLKPENLLLDKRGHVKLVDYGFAKVVQDKTYTVCGTPEYIAPEVLSGRGHGLMADYWSLGVLIYEMLVGHGPFSATTHYKLFELILAAQYDMDPKISPAAGESCPPPRSSFSIFFFFLISSPQTQPP